MKSKLFWVVFLILGCIGVVVNIITQTWLSLMFSAITTVISSIELMTNRTPPAF